MISIVKDYYTRWLAAGNEAHACIQEKKPFSHLPLGGGSLIGGRKN